MLRFSSSVWMFQEKKRKKTPRKTSLWHTKCLHSDTLCCSWSVRGSIVGHKCSDGKRIGQVSNQSQSPVILRSSNSSAVRGGGSAATGGVCNKRSTQRCFLGGWVFRFAPLNWELKVRDVAIVKIGPSTRCYSEAYNLWKIEVMTPQTLQEFTYNHD